jgi:hypothetical protein
MIDKRCNLDTILQEIVAFNRIQFDSAIVSQHQTIQGIIPDSAVKSPHVSTRKEANCLEIVIVVLWERLIRSCRELRLVLKLRRLVNQGLWWGHGRSLHQM